MTINSNIDNTPKPCVIFESSKIKYPNTGLHTFCKELSTALYKEAKNRDSRLYIFLKTKYRNRVSEDIPYIAQKPWHSIFLNLNKKYNIWHSPFQMSKIFPKSEQKVLLTIHDLNFLYEKGPKKIEWYKRIVQNNINHSHHIVAISEFVKQDIMNYYNIKESDISVVYNGSTPYDGELIKPQIVDSSKQFLFTVGTILPKKNFHVLPALLVGNDYYLVISGNESPYISRIEEEARKWGVEDRVIITGPISEPEKNWLYKNCEAFLFPSIAEGFGLPVVEAMRYGKPIFLSKHTSLPEIGGEDAFYFDWDFTPEKMRVILKDGIDKFKSDPNIREKLIDRANLFTWENAAKSYFDIYEKLLRSEL
ncbi:MAG: glycosyltransferase family 4 protein [Bacteroidales bacterium]